MTILRSHLAVLLAAATPMNAPQEVGGADELPATLRPVPSDEDRAAAAGWLDGRPWMAQHEDICRLGREEGLDLVFLGDSITQSWGGPGRRVSVTGGSTWKEFYAQRRAANFGISGDRTQHVLWRVQNGAFDGLQPKVVVLLIGTNNAASDGAGAIAIGVREIASELRQRLPETRLLVLGVLPRGGPDDPLRTKVEEVNERLSQSLWLDGTTYLDLASTFLDEDGSLVAELYSADALHLAPKGYAAWARAIEPLLAEWLGDAARDGK